MNINFKKAGLAAAICAATVVGGAAAAVPASAATGSAIEISSARLAFEGATQPVTPGMVPGQTGLATVRLSTVGAVKPVGIVFVVKAPSGTRFASGDVAVNGSNGFTGTFAGVLSDGGKTLTVTRATYQVPADGWTDHTFSLVSDTDNSREGAVNDGEFRVTAGPNMPVGTNTTLSYTALPALAPASQTGTPTLAPGATGPAVIRTTNTGAVKPVGIVFVVKAPSGTRFASGDVAVNGSNGFTGTFAGVLSDGGKTLTVTRATYQVPADGWTDHTFSLVSDTDNSRDGAVNDGEFRVTAGPNMSVGTTSTLTYTATDPVVAPAPVEFTGASTDAHPVFSGTGIPGATITITLPDGRVLGTTHVTPEGAWEVTSDTELAEGEYTFTATQTGTGVTESSDTITVTVVGAPIADPMIAGGAGMALLAGAGAVFAIRRRRTAQA